ncbi:MAG: glycine betaine ABC transporter substrate-binding protein [Bryobacteraceae bacterium]|nr:glycine betaine ABC transporter substrate-binding protein [Bryobacteraceae bacterium]
MRFAAANYCVLAMIAAAVGCSHGAPVVVGSRAGTEQSILSEIIAQQIEKKTALRVERRAAFTSTSQTSEALAGGQVDLYVEYTGSAMINCLRLPAVADASAVRDQVRSEYREKLRVEMLDPLGFDARPAVLARASLAKEKGLDSLNQLERLTDARWRLGITYDFLERQDGLKLLNRNYNIALDGAARTFDPRLLGKALANDEINLMAGHQSDAVLMEPGIVALTDDKNCFPPYEASIIVRREALNANKGLEAALRALSGKVDIQTIRRLNHAVEFGKRPPADVAREFLAKL